MTSIQVHSPAPPAPTPAQRRPASRFQPVRATLILLLASFSMLGYSAVQASQSPSGGHGPGGSLQMTTSTTGQAASSQASAPEQP